MQVTAAEVLAQVRSAFGVDARPPHEAMLLKRYRNSIDACEMAEAFAGRAWPELSRRELFLHREMMIAMSAQAFRACLPAYLAAAIENVSDGYSGDLRTYLVLALSEDSQPIELARERLSLLDDARRAATANVLRYLAESQDMRQARALLAAWRS